MKETYVVIEHTTDGDGADLIRAVCSSMKKAESFKEELAVNTSEKLKQIAEQRYEDLLFNKSQLTQHIENLKHCMYKKGETWDENDSDSELLRKDCFKYTDVDFAKQYIRIETWGIDSLYNTKKMKTLKEEFEDEVYFGDVMESLLQKIDKWMCEDDEETRSVRFPLMPGEECMSIVSKSNFESGRGEHITLSEHDPRVVYLWSYPNMNRVVLYYLGDNEWEFRESGGKMRLNYPWTKDGFLQVVEQLWV